MFFFLFVCLVVFFLTCEPYKKTMSAQDEASILVILTKLNCFSSL